VLGECTLRLGRRALVLACAGAAAAVAVSSSATTPFTPGGTLDPTFGRRGAVLTRLGPDHPSNVIALLPLPNGMILAGGVAEHENGSQDGVVVRYRDDGSLDGSFGQAGVVRPRAELRWTAVLDLARQRDGRIVGVGYAARAADDPEDDRRGILLFRLEPNGTLDTSFGNGGVVTTDLPETPVELGVAVELLADGRILVAGQAGVAYREGRDFLLLRYSRDGVLDRSFGPVRTSVPGKAAFLQDVALTKEGAIVAVGVVEDEDAHTLDYGLIARYSADGRLDARFGADGLVQTRFSIGQTWLGAVVVQPDGRVVVAGTASVGQTFASRAALFRYGPSGAPDRSFGAGGEVLTRFRFGAGWSAMVYRGGKLFLAGWEWPVRPGPQHFALARYRGADGSLDPSFGRAGRVAGRLPGTESSHAYALAVDRRGRLLAGGGAFNGNGFRFALARYRAG
jgi:uncharacterized delta-60 repeat protein